ncbi:hypothetical protein BKA70DRAFT_1417275 [Coprinopsis sp. MPI-PUGE-AT-0042]|nr:hypothetical protein BKA70DRAFT_1417275 [Coprinopsis sp. MPI-PUGE-AT-0042]
MPQKPLQLDKANNAYFVITLSPSGSVYSTPAALAELHPSLKYVGQVGELEDTHMYSSPLDKEDVIATFLKERRQGREGIARVDFPEERDIYRRSKRDEFVMKVLPTSGILGNSRIREVYHVLYNKTIDLARKP